MNASQQNEKKLDFSGDFLSVIRGLVGVFPKHQKNPPPFFLKQQNAPLVQKSYQFMLYFIGLRIYLTI
ncbi:hypothetical protein BGL84_01030 [Helicobacter pylori]|nr:hypothetical protein BGL84_01030 [Helicobacter pylori]